ncbi:hypothetical protein, partial [Moraxella catarrhalis]|uniref:hypothetical protein n=1 Tax=Moraxella catarrhalis TaxID=480 RepID=UPI0022288533
MIETTTKLLTSYQIFLNQAKDNANNQITANKTQAITNINEAKENATTQINTNKTQSLEAITQAKKTAFNELLETLKPKFSGLFAGVYYIHNAIYIQGGWEQKVKDL